MGSRYLEPGFFIIGERKCGTSSLYRYLCEHPQRVPCRVKEPQFFSRSLAYRIFNYGNYRRLFPVAGSDVPVILEWIELKSDGTYSTREISYERVSDKFEVTGEASANTLAMVPPKRMKRFYPEALYIAILRDPVERAYSHYKMLRRFEAEGRKLPFKPTDFKTDVISEISNIRSGKSSYFVAPGMYSENLGKWLEAFSKDQVLVLFSDDLLLYNSRLMVLRDIASRLGIEEFNFQGTEEYKSNVSPGTGVPDDAAEILQAFYLQYNTKLERMLNKPLPWN